MGDPAEIPPGSSERANRDHGAAERPVLAGVEVREDDLNPQPGLHFVAILFRALAVLLLVLMVVQLALGLGDPAPGQTGVVLGQAVRLLVFAGLLWAAGDLSMIWIQTHYDVRAARILLARQTYMIREMGLRSGELPPRATQHREVDAVAEPQ